MKVIKILSVCIFLFIMGCESDSSYNEEDTAVESAGQSIEDAAEEDMLSSPEAEHDMMKEKPTYKPQIGEMKEVGAQEMEYYCCTNHNPAHCGNSDELESLAEDKGCEGFD